MKERNGRQKKERSWTKDYGSSINFNNGKAQKEVSLFDSINSLVRKAINFKDPGRDALTHT